MNTQELIDSIYTRHSDVLDAVFGTAIPINVTRLALRLALTELTERLPQAKLTELAERLLQKTLKED